jgi:hypothetical protein
VWFRFPNPHLLPDRDGQLALEAGDRTLGTIMSLFDELLTHGYRPPESYEK